MAAKVPRISRDDWIQRFNIIYGDKFLYPDIKFGKASEKIKVICNLNTAIKFTPKDAKEISKNNTIDFDNSNINLHIQMSLYEMSSNIYK